MKKQLIVGLILVVLMACVSVVSAYPSHPWKSDAGVMPTVVAYPINPHCPAGTTEYKIDSDVFGQPIPTGSYSNGLGFSVKINVMDPGNIYWGEATEPVHTVIVKDGKYYAESGNWANVYTYVPTPRAGYTDNSLYVPPMDIDSLKFGQVSHITFCYTEDDDQQQVPEFPALALPVGMIIGFLGIVLYIRGTKEN
jgi:hypothetical protein